jgi:multidrug efflux system outer membrane protein
LSWLGWFKIRYKWLIKKAIILILVILVSSCTIVPEPLTSDEIGLVAEEDKELIFKNQEPQLGPLSLDRAIAMALKYNLENRVKLMEQALAYQTFELAKLEMLPELTVYGGYNERDSDNASFSNSILSGQQSLEPSTSQSRDIVDADVTFSWRLLDFGVSYLQAKQDADRYLIAVNARKKVMLVLMQEVRAAYWKAMVMDTMKEEVSEVAAKVVNMRENLEVVRQERLKTPVAVLEDIRILIETTQQLDQIQQAISTEKTRLATLINAPSYEEIEFPELDQFPELLDVTDDFDVMEMLALSNSADYANELYNARIEQVETRKTMLQLLPELEFRYSSNYNDNTFLLNKSWRQLGVNLTSDIVRLASYRQIKKFRETNEQIIINRKLAINMAVVTGMHISWQDYQNARKQLKQAEYLNDLDNELAKLAAGAERSSKGTGVATIENELRALRSKLSQMQTYASAQEAYGSFTLSLGVNPIPKNYQAYSVGELGNLVSTELEALMSPFVKVVVLPDLPPSLNQYRGDFGLSVAVKMEEIGKQYASS